MKHTIFIFFLVLGATQTYAGNDFQEPKITPNRALKLIEGYLKTRKIELDKYKLGAFSYNYLDKKWFAFYDYKKCPCRVGSHFSVYIVSEEPIKYKFVPGL
ncbi:MAG: hypothetical protein ACU837_10010 [Gammaproteobacteria bacterium]